nr:glycoside hydrolase family 172 protein [Parabacteroides pacaensis]
MKNKRNLYAVCLMVLTLAGWNLLSGCTGKSKTITVETLLDEMVSVEENARYPAVPYRCLQVSSYDRSSVSPGKPHWFANNDGFGIVRTDTVEGRIENVMFDEKGPGVITRIWITTVDKRGSWRFYFDGSPVAGWVIPAYDLMRFGIPSLGRGLLQPHTSYTPEGKGGNTLFLPIPFAQACKVTFESAPDMPPTPRYYHINYRKYPEGTPVETFSAEVALRAAEKIRTTDACLLNSPAVPAGTVVENKKRLAPGDSLVLALPGGQQAVYALKMQIHPSDTATYARQMRQLILQGTFDGKQTVQVPVSDFSGGGIGAPYVKSWFLVSDGKGTVNSRWLMPYKQTASLAWINTSEDALEITVSATVAPLKWDNRSLYFHASWKQADGLPVYNHPEEDENCTEWNFATLTGRGVYKGDVLTLFNHSPAWYGEGDEKIWVDGDTFPSHFGTGTEDYYNSSWAPVIPFHTPFGGAPRADEESSHGYNTFFRTRNLDGIPFTERLRFDIEMLSWVKGTVDYATTVFWYGDANAEAENLSEIKRTKL